MTGESKQRKSALEEATLKAVERSAGDLTRTVAALTRAILADQTLLKEAAPIAAESLAQTAIRQQRSLIWARGPQALGDELPVDIGTQNGRALLRATLLDYPLHNGKRLGDALAEDLTVDIEFHRRNAIGNAAKHRWLLMIQLKLAPGKRVKDVLTVEQLESMRARARRRAEGKK